MSHNLKSPRLEEQEIYSSSTNISSSNGDRGSNLKDSSASVELQALENGPGPTPPTSNSKNGANEATSSSPPSHRSPSSRRGTSPSSSDNSSVNAASPRWQHGSTNTYNHGIMKALRRTKLLAVWTWICGPSPPHSITFKPLFPRWQSLPSRYLSKWLGKQRGELIYVIACFIMWITVFSVLLARSAIGSMSGFSVEQPVRLSCTAALWDKPSSCGIDGKNCEPFDGQPFAFLCPSNCLSAQVLNPYTIGDEQINYRPLVIGGPNASADNLPVYRGDSFICSSAIHAGIVTNARGGCGLYTRHGTQTNFTSSNSNGITSIGFPSSFPLSFSISSIDTNCDDPQWSAFAVSVLFTALISLVVTSAIIFTTTMFIMVFFQIGLISSAPYYVNYPSVISTAFARFLPAAFIIVVIYRYCIRRTLRRLEARWERTVLWLGGCWVGAMNDYTFDKIPIQRLTAHDLQQQPGAIVALIVIVVVIVLIAIGQIWFYRLEGRLPRFLAFYIAIGIIIGCLTAIPALSFRLHHYILALLLLPGTALQTRPTLLYQGLLVGLFINGVARWGFASILQTPASLAGDAQTNSALPMNISHEIIANNATIRFNITDLATGFDGLSILVNDVERYQQSRVDLPVSFNFTRSDNNLYEPLFFRFAFTATYTLGGIIFGDYTKAGTWFGNGTWMEMLPGPS